MADNNKLELVVEVDVNKANASTKRVNTGLSGMERAGRAARQPRFLRRTTSNLVKTAFAYGFWLPFDHGCILRLGRRPGSEWCSYPGCGSDLLIWVKSR